MISEITKSTTGHGGVPEIPSQVTNRAEKLEFSGSFPVPTFHQCQISMVKSVFYSLRQGS